MTQFAKVHVKNLKKEIQENPNKIAHTMMKKFEYLMGWYGKKYCPIDLYDGSFMDQPSKWRNVKNSRNDADFDWRREATVIFVNNYAFSEKLNLEVILSLEIFWNSQNRQNTKIFNLLDVENP